jgi:hypothetical protein
MVFSIRSFRFCFTFWAVEVFSFQVSVDRTNREGRGDCEIRQPVVFGNALHEIATGFPVFDGFPQETVEDGPTGVLGLQNVLVV